MHLRTISSATLIAIMALGTAPAHAAPKGCPPGLAKKSPSCVPPGLARNQAIDDRDRDRDGDRDGDHYHYRVGEVIEAGDYIVIRNPDLYGLDPRYTYYRTDGQVFRVDRETREILDLIGAVTAILD